MDCLALIKQDIDSWNRWRLTQSETQLSLAGQDLSHGYFFEGDFSGVDLSGADLRRACLIGANFRDANLTGADLRDAYLGDASFESANLSNANLLGAHLDGVDLARAQFLEHALLTERVLTGKGSVEPALDSDKTVPAAQRQTALKSTPRNPVVKMVIARLSQRPNAHRQRPWNLLTR